MHRTTRHSLPTVTAAPRRGRLLYVVLLGLAWLQLAYASHQFEHAAGELTDSCAVCSNFERLEHSVAPAADAGHLCQAHPVFLPTTERSLHVRCERHYSSRAPPVV